MVQSNNYYKSRAVDVTSDVGLITDRELRLLYLRDIGSHVVRATIQQLRSKYHLLKKMVLSAVSNKILLNGKI